MTPTLETKLAQILDHVDRMQPGNGAMAQSQDSLGMRYALLDREVAAWLDQHRARGIPLGTILHKG